MLNRIETDFLGKKSIPADALFGIHGARAMENFPLSHRSVHSELIKALGTIKLACLKTINDLSLARTSKETANAIEEAALEVANGQHSNQVLCDALQGGAGTSLNMTINEIIANRALLILGKKCGDYSIISPTDDINRFQSTNDTYPTALRLAAIRSLKILEQRIVSLQESFQLKEQVFAHIVKIGRTEFQDAVLTTLGKEMGAYSEVLTAIGFARAENMVEATQNCDAFVEVSGFLKTLASSLIKISNDLRLLSSGPKGGFGEIKLPVKQAGSSIMPGKINPVIPEAVIQASMYVIGLDSTLTQACSSGSLELNAFMPLIADCLLTQIDLLANACEILEMQCVSGLIANEEQCSKNVEASTALITALVPALGYEKASAIAKESELTGESTKSIAIRQGLLTVEQFSELISPEVVCRLGSMEN